MKNLMIVTLLSLLMSGCAKTTPIALDPQSCVLDNADPNLTTTMICNLDCGNHCLNYSYWNEVSGFENYPNLEKLSITGRFHQYKAIDVSQNTALTELTLHTMSLESLDVSSNQQLKKLTIIGHNSLEKDIVLSKYFIPLLELDLSNNLQLTHLKLEEIKIEGVDLSLQTELTHVEIFNAGTRFSYPALDIDLSANSKLVKLDLSSTKIADIDLTANTMLTHIDLSYNDVSDLDLGGNTSLVELSLTGNDLTSIDLDSNTSLTTLDLSYNDLVTLDISGLPLLDDIYVGSNQLSTIQVGSNNSTILRFAASHNELSQLDLDYLTGLERLSLRDNQFSEIELSSNTSLTMVNIDKNPLSPETISYLETIDWILHLIY